MRHRSTREKFTFPRGISRMLDHVCRLKRSGACKSRRVAIVTGEQSRRIRNDFAMRRITTRTIFPRRDTSGYKVDVVVSSRTNHACFHVCAPLRRLMHSTDAPKGSLICIQRAQWIHDFATATREREREREKFCKRHSCKFRPPLGVARNGRKTFFEWTKAKLFRIHYFNISFSRPLVPYLYIYIELNECFIACFEILRNIFKQFFFSWYNFRIIF